MPRQMRRESPSWEYKTVTSPGPLSPRRMASEAARRWELFTVLRTDDGRLEHSFRRKPKPASARPSTTQCVKPTGVHR